MCGFEIEVCDLCVAVWQGLSSQAHANSCLPRWGHVKDFRLQQDNIPQPVLCCTVSLFKKKHPKTGHNRLVIFSLLCNAYFSFYWRKAQLGLNTLVFPCPFNEEAQVVAVLVSQVMEWCLTQLPLLGNNSCPTAWWETMGRVTTATSAWGKQYAAQLLAQEDTEVPASRINTALKKMLYGRNQASVFEGLCKTWLLIKSELIS